MLDALTITEAEAQGLAELAALDLAMARDFAARAQAAKDDPQVANDLARSYQRVARSYRQTLALKMRLAREMAAAQREVGTQRPASTFDRTELPAVRRRADEVHEAVTRVVWTEYEGPEHENARKFVVQMLEEGLYEAAQVRGFTDRPLDDHVAQVCEELGLSPDLAARWRELPDPPFEDAAPDAEPEPEPAWRGSG